MNMALVVEPISPGTDQLRALPLLSLKRLCTQSLPGLTLTLPCTHTPGRYTLAPLWLVSWIMYFHITYQLDIEKIYFHILSHLILHQSYKDNIILSLLFERKNCKSQNGQVTCPQFLKIQTENLLQSSSSYLFYIVCLSPSLCLSLSLHNILSRYFMQVKKGLQ